jgi:hypothetical protein
MRNTEQTSVFVDMIGKVHLWETEIILARSRS